MNPKTFMLIAGEASRGFARGGTGIRAACRVEAKRRRARPAILRRGRCAHGVSRRRAGLRHDAALGHRHFRRAEKLFQSSGGCSTNCWRWRLNANRTSSSAWITAGSTCASAMPSSSKCENNLVTGVRIRRIRGALITSTQNYYTHIAQNS